MAVISSYCVNPERELFYYIIYKINRIGMRMSRVHL